MDKINKKSLAIIIIAIIIVIALVGVFSLGLGTNNEISDSTNWQVKDLAGVKFKVPSKYEQGTTLTGNVIDGVNTGNSYQSEDLIIRVNDANWTSELNKHMNAVSPMTLLNIEGKDINVFNADGNSIAFFKVNNNTITMSWSGDNISGDVKAIIASFFQENK